MEHYHAQRTMPPKRVSRHKLFTVSNVNCLEHLVLWLEYLVFCNLRAKLSPALVIGCQPDLALLSSSLLPLPTVIDGKKNGLVCFQRLQQCNFPLQWLLDWFSFFANHTAPILSQVSSVQLSVQHQHCLTPRISRRRKLPLILLLLLGGFLMRYRWIISFVLPRRGWIDICCSTARRRECELVYYCGQIRLDCS